MKFYIPFAVVFTIVCEPGGTESHDQKSDGRSLQNGNRIKPNLTTMEMIREFGYPAEAHTVQTEDGYILEIHRIPPKTKTKKAPVVLIQHGLLGSSADFFLISSRDALPFLLSNLGFDVWLGNLRGNTYGRLHVTLEPHYPQFWNYTWHESALYDLPAHINYITNITRQKKIFYIGYSMGTTMFFVLTSTLPEYNEKFELGLMLAPVAYMTHMRSPLMLLLAKYVTHSLFPFKLIESSQFLVDSKLVHYATSFVCSLPLVNKLICKSIVFLVCGSDPGQFDEALLPVLFNHFPAGYSVRALIHYAQLIKSGGFLQYDYGTKGNLLQYGKPKPPEYNIDRITAPIYFYAGVNDYLTDIEDVLKFSEKLKSLKETRVVPNNKFSHLDFVMAKDVKTLLYDKVLQDIKSHLKKKTVKELIYNLNNETFY